jgi:hypothetical protein
MTNNYPTQARPAGGIVLSILAAALLANPLAGCAELDLASPETELGDPEESGDEAVGQTEQAITNRDDLETISRRNGEYKEVLGVYTSASATTRACTATIIGPHAAITASHCPASGYVKWRASSTSFSFSSLAAPYINQPYWPDWWAAGNLQQIAMGIRDDDWPANHDLRVLFIPGLSAEILADYLRTDDVQPAAIAAHELADAFTVVGIQSELRDIADTGFQPAAATMYSNQQCTGNPRNGYLTRDYSSMAEGGDSGGPTLGASLDAVEGPRHMVSVTSNSCNDTAPLAYDAGISLRPEQELTIRLNQLWARAAAGDADRDNIPAACDANPASTASSALSSDNLCPDPIGGPYDDETVPRALVECPDGYLMTGVQGRHGWYVDQLSLRCTSMACLETGDCDDSLWTDHFGEGGSASPSFAYECPSGSVVAYINGQHTPAATSGGVVNKLRVYCYDYAALAAGSYSYRGASSTYGSVAGSSYARMCGDHGAFSGFELRSSHTQPYQAGQVNNMKYLTGMQPICSDTHRQLTYYAGGAGGEDGVLNCPGDTIAVGTVARPYSYTGSTRLGLFGVLCKDPAAGTADSDLIAVHGSDYGSAGLYPRAVEKYTTLLANTSGTVATKCSSGYGLSGVHIAHDGTFATRLATVECTALGGTTRQYFYPNVGGTGGTTSALYCPGYDITKGLLISSGWLTDGVALRCEP